MRRLAPLAALPLALGAFAAPAPAAGPVTTAQDDAALRANLARQMRSAGRSSGAYVRNVTEGRTVYRLRSGSSRTLASNTKLFTTAAVLDRFGVARTLPTTALATAPVDSAGVLGGDLVLRGGGDPTFGSAAFTRRAYGGGATVESLAARVAAAGVKRVAGRVLGDESRFDALRGGPASGYGTSYYVGPLSALAYNRGLANERGSAFQTRPPAFAATRLDAALERRGVMVAGAPRAGTAPQGVTRIAEVRSPPMARIAQITNKPSDNFFAEVLLKDLGAEVAGSGTTAAGARAARGFAQGLGVQPNLVDGSGLSHANRATPAGVGRLLDRARSRPEFPAFFESLAVAGRDGTLATRMRSGAAAGRCRGKTGTLNGVSALSGYCTSRSGDLFVFSFLMNRVNASGARRLQDRMAQALAGYRG